MQARHLQLSVSVSPLPGSVRGESSRNAAFVPTPTFPVHRCASSSHWTAMRRRSLLWLSHGSASADGGMTRSSRSPVRLPTLMELSGCTPNTSARHFSTDQREPPGTPEPGNSTATMLISEVQTLLGTFRQGLVAERPLSLIHI